MLCRRVLLWLLLCLPVPAAAQPAADPPGVPPALTIGGYVQFDYLAPPATSPPEHDSFRFRRARLQLSGGITDSVAWAVSVEGTRTPILRDAFVTFSYFPAAVVRVGQLMMPYGLEQYTFSSNTLEFTERLLTDLVPARDAGVMVSNERPFFEWFTYAAAVINGTGQNTPDDNRAKDILLRLTATPPRPGGLAVSANIARGDQPPGMRTRQGMDVTFERRAYHLAAEFVREETVGSPPLSGMYILGAWRVYPSRPRTGFDHVEFASRFGRNTRRVANASQLDLAANYYVHAKMRFMWNLTIYTDAEPGSGRTGFQARANVRF